MPHKVDRDGDPQVSVGPSQKSGASNTSFISGGMACAVPVLGWEPLVRELLVAG